MENLFGGSEQIVWVISKALLLYVTAVIGFRLSKRRTLAEMSPFDFVAAIAVGAIVGRVPNAGSTSYVAGAATLGTLLVSHSVIARLRQFPAITNLIQHSPRLLFADGRLLDHELKRCGLTKNDVFGLLRHRGVADLNQVRYVIFEQRGVISIVFQEMKDNKDSGLIREVIDEIY